MQYLRTGETSKKYNRKKKSIRSLTVRCTEKYVIILEEMLKLTVIKNILKIIHAKVEIKVKNYSPLMPIPKKACRG